MSDETPIDPTVLLRELAQILNDTDMFEVEVKQGDLKVRLSRGPSSAAAPQIQAYAPPPAPEPSAPAAHASPPPAAESEPSGPPKDAATSPMVGTVYLRPSPDEPVFAEVGGTVKEGDTILLIEAMKTFNPITAPKAGTLSRILVTDGQPVEYGEPLFLID